MEKTNQLGPQKLWKGSLMFVSFFLFAACMQHDESLAPRNPYNDALLRNGDPQSAANTTARMMKSTFTAHLNGSNEVGPVASQGQGQAIFTINEDETAIRYKLIIANTDDVFVAHIHCGAEGVNGPPVAFLFESAEPVSSNGVLAEGVISSADLIERPAPACDGGLVTFEELIARMRSGGLYVNAHTTLHPGGEIRGQIE